MPWFRVSICIVYACFVSASLIAHVYIWIVFILIMYFIHLLVILVCIIYVEYSAASLADVIAFIYVVSIFASYICIYLLAFECSFLQFSIFCQEYIWHGFMRFWYTFILFLACSRNADVSRFISVMCVYKVVVLLHLLRVFIAKV